MPIRPNIVLIDFENVQPATLAALEQRQCKVFVFVGANQTKISFEIASAMQRMGDRAEYIKISGTGPNALDFHIAYYIGKMSADEPSAYFHIVSKDSGFDPLIAHLKSRKILSSRVKEIDDISFIKIGEAKTPKEKLSVIVEKLAKNEANRPKTVKTLSSLIATLFQKQIGEEEVAALVEMLRTKGHLSIDDKKVSYILSRME